MTTKVAPKDSAEGKASVMNTSVRFSSQKPATTTAVVERHIATPIASCSSRQPAPAVCQQKLAGPWRRQHTAHATDRALLPGRASAHASVVGSSFRRGRQILVFDSAPWFESVCDIC